MIETGAVSTDHPTHPRVQKDRERDRGLRNISEITIETYTNQIFSDSSDCYSAEAMSTNEQQQNVNRPDISVPSSSREATPLEEGQCASELPKEIGYFSGNPSVEITRGIIHLYKKK